MTERERYFRNPPRELLTKELLLLVYLLMFGIVVMYAKYTGYINIPISIILLLIALYYAEKQAKKYKALPLVTKEIKYEGIHDSKPLLVHVYLHYPLKDDSFNLFAESEVVAKKLLSRLVPQDITITDIENQLFDALLPVVRQYDINVFRVRVIEEDLSNPQKEGIIIGHAKR